MSLNASPRAAARERTRSAFYTCFTRPLTSSSVTFRIRRIFVRFVRFGLPGNITTGLSATFGCDSWLMIQHANDGLAREPSDPHRYDLSLAAALDAPYAVALLRARRCDEKSKEHRALGGDPDRNGSMGGSGRL